MLINITISILRVATLILIVFLTWGMLKKDE